MKFHADSYTSKKVTSKLHKLTNYKSNYTNAMYIDVDSIHGIAYNISDPINISSCILRAYIRGYSTW